MSGENWVDIGGESELACRELQQVTVARTRMAVSFLNGQLSVISGVCNHVGGPLGEGQLVGDYIVCPWHHWKFHHRTGEGEPGFDDDRVPRYSVKVVEGRVLVDLASATTRTKKPHKAHPLARPILRASGPIRVVGISTTMMNPGNPRYSTSDALLETALDHARSRGCETEIIRLRELTFRHCEGYYSKSARACTWPCSITQADPKDQLDRVYEAIVHWGDVIIISTPIRWGAASSLYFKMVERMNCIQNQETIANRHLLKNKTVGFIITGGQDNVQAVAGQMMAFFAEVGCQFPQFPFIAHSRGWSAEDMENNVRYVQDSDTLHDGARALIDRAFSMATLLVAGALGEESLARGGRKGHHIELKQKDDGV
jgi:multimeric flavodoxin WrbA/nitrite reductase/ring-hydroxylating ferredoxin subunit